MQRLIVEIEDFKVVSEKLKKYYSDNTQECVSIWFNFDTGYDQIEVMRRVLSIRDGHIATFMCTSYSMDDFEKVLKVWE